MKRQIISFLLALIGLTSAWAEDYGVSVGGVAVTSSNYTNISASGGFPAVSSGTVRYNPTTRTLTLTDAVISISGGYSGIDFNGFSEDYNLVLTEGTVNVVTAVNAPGLFTSRPLTISGGTAVIKSNGHCGIYAMYGSSNDYTLNIENSNIVVSGKWGIAGDNEYGTININNSIVSATGTSGSVCDLKAVKLTRTKLYAPDGATWVATSHAVCDAGGTKVTATIAFLPESNDSGSGIGNTGGSGLFGDLDGNGERTIADVTTLVNLLVNPPEDLSGTIDGHEYVDLGLPSGTLWATCNIGASSPEDYGDYFAWGETVPYGNEDTSNATNYAYNNSYVKNYYEWNTYKYCQGSENTLTKYTFANCGYNGFSDGLTKLSYFDDAAYANWGNNWCMPSDEQFSELINSEYTTAERATTQSGVKGFKFTSRTNGHSIFLPTAGSRYRASLSSEGEYGYYWANTIYAPQLSNFAWSLRIGSKAEMTNSFRYGGHNIRPVRKK